MDASDAGKERVAIVLHSGAYDRVTYAISMATVALAMGCQVHILLTYEGLQRFSRGRLEELTGEMPAITKDRIKWGLASGGIQPLRQLVAEAKKLGLKLYACPNAMANLNISRDELAPEVDEVQGLATFMEFALGARNTWYI